MLGRKGCFSLSGKGNVFLPSLRCIRGIYSKLCALGISVLTDVQIDFMIQKAAFVC